MQCMRTSATLALPGEHRRLHRCVLVLTLLPPITADTHSTLRLNCHRGILHPLQEGAPLTAGLARLQRWGGHPSRACPPPARPPRCLAARSGQRHGCRRLAVCHCVQVGGLLA
jgi:hypothetical protein